MDQTLCTVVKSNGKISQNFVAFSEYMNFTCLKKHEIDVHKIKIRLGTDFGPVMLALTKLIGLRHSIQSDKLYVGTFNPKSEDNGIK